MEYYPFNMHIEREKTSDHSPGMISWIIERKSIKLPPTETMETNNYSWIKNYKINFSIRFVKMKIKIKIKLLFKFKFIKIRLEFLQ